MDIQKIRKNVKKYLDEKRYAHVERVVKCAKELAEIYKVDTKRAEVAALLHDVAKFFELPQMLDLVKGKYPEIENKIFKTNAVLHGFAGAEFVKKNYDLFEVDDEEILDAVRYHTIGAENMTTLCKIIYLADAIEEKRDWDGVETARELATKDLDLAIKFEIDKKLEYLLDRDTVIHPNIIKLRNSVLK
ncbi:bis(5'-nucleosyl)-tetraphosphatase (symmetrical) YqeK [Leptotrichia sp. oral taxon 847]|uniref:bis(5'-nucleosyl)-tetraphosphatase (symmetrical) YqeK n=1 Tax=Leptotrichia sp. oral taxon 847 TaxID=1785996 RepID=UPI000768248E|nr:bis(5'-nucleosyl)-tetraphosphatase (symmetrical) YqeK [Leptotrichia sp. oral taxon 847]AMD95346.1 phosphohydrolase [Leptotrichia sp. oral taxon 847]